MAVSKKRAEEARKSQLEKFINQPAGNGQEDIEKPDEARSPRKKKTEEVLENSGIVNPDPNLVDEKNSKKKSNSDYIRLDIADYKEYLRIMAGFDTIKSAKTVSVTKYIQNLISADMEARKNEYEKIKNI